MMGEKIMFFRKAISLICIQMCVNMRSAFAINAPNLLMVFVCAYRKISLANINRNPDSF